ncbi:unnamed protein product, partial [Tuber aestivum]
QPQEASRPYRIIPYSRNSRFTGRESLIDSLKRLCKPDGHNRIALHGLGGSGKTQIALEYVYRRASESDCNIFWVQGSGVLRFREGFGAIAQRVRIPLASAETEEEGFLLSIKRWFEGPESGDWILVIDNAENEEDFAGNNSPIAKFVPQGPRGTLIFTTRSRQVAFRQECERIEVGKMEREEAQALFSKHFGGWGGLRDREGEVVAMILGSVDHLPLAVVGAAAFMVETETSPSEYWTISQENDKQMKGLLLEQFSDIRRESDMTESILGTYFITFDRITKQMPTAGHLLRLIAFFDRQNIPEQLLRESGVEGLDGSIQFRRAIAKLVGFSLVTATKREDKTFYEVHRLIQLSIHAYLSPEELDRWSGAALGLVSRMFPKYKHELRNICKAYIPHALAVTKGRIDTIAEDLYHLDTLGSAKNLAWVLQRQGKYDESETLNRRALKGHEKALGPDHPDTLKSLSNLAWVLQQQGKYDESGTMHRRVLEGRERLLGPDHPNTLGSLNNLAIMLEYQGNYGESETMHRRALEGRERVLGPDHPYSLGSLNNLAIVLEYQGKYGESETMHRRALEVREKVLGPDHPDTLKSLNNLAIVLQHQGKYGESETMHRCALEGRERVLGPDHPNTLGSLNNLAIVLEFQGKYGESETMHRRALKGRKKVLGPDHPDTLKSLNNLAIVLKYQGKYGESETMHRRTLEGREKVLRQGHPDTLASLENLAIVLGSQGKYDESEAMRR